VEIAGTVAGLLRALLLALPIIHSAECFTVSQFQVFKAVTMNYTVMWDVTLCGSCKEQRFGGTNRLHHQDCKIWRAGTLELTSNRSKLRYLPPKRQFLQEPHGVTSQKTAFFISIYYPGLIK
jgi:hypothetical protein